MGLGVTQIFQRKQKKTRGDSKPFEAVFFKAQPTSHHSCIDVPLAGVDGFFLFIRKPTAIGYHQKRDQLGIVHLQNWDENLPCLKVSKHLIFRNQKSGEKYKKFVALFLRICVFVGG